MSTDKKLVVFDLDGVLAMFVLYFSQWIIASNLTGISLPDKTQHSLGYTQEEFNRLHDLFAKDGKFASIPVYTDTLKVIHILAERGYEISYFTARHSLTRNDFLNLLIQGETSKWLKKIGVPYPKNLHFCGTGLKCDTFLTLGGMAMIEDHFGTVEDIGKLKVHQSGLPVMSFLVDRPWNQGPNYPRRLMQISDLLPHFP